jgi:hypothetical protein
MRRGLEGASSGAGLHIKRDDAEVLLGTAGDVGMKRTGTGELSMQGRVLVDDLDVGATLGLLTEKLSAAATTGTQLDTLVEVVRACLNWYLCTCVRSADVLRITIITIIIMT